ncbi:MAG TPA: ornithine cyclodeaminase family protein [Gemmatimonadales bacterium]|nr:ornithine cyclodeaminase family protein [Gemmatimonadales bacterium]
MPTLLLTRTDVAELLPMPDCIAAVAEAFRAHAEGKTPAPPGILGAHLEGGGFHIKTAAMAGTPGYFVAKINANFPANPARFGLPTIQGVIALFETASGRLLALLDSIEVTVLRTAAASALAARELALPEAASVTLLGCGTQARAHLRALACVRTLCRVRALDQDPARARELVRDLGAELGVEMTAESDLGAAVAASQICVTCTTSKQPVFTRAFLHPGLFIAAVGADNPEKQEMEPAVMAAARVVVDVPEQAPTIGDLHHAIAAGAMTPEGIHATLGQVLAGQRPGRRTAEEIFVFDSTGTALQDVAASVVVYERARQSGRGVEISLA